MADLEQKLQLMSQSILDEAKSEGDNIVNQAEKIKQDSFEKAKDEVLNELFIKMQNTLAEVKEETARKIAKCEFESRQELLKMRVETAQSVFNAVKQKLIVYTASEEYKAKILQNIAELAKQYSDFELSFKPQDNTLFNEIKSVCQNCNVKLTEDKNIKIGGFLLTIPKSRIVMDNTLDSRLEGQKSWFYTNSGLTIS